ncbi:MFS transporter [Sphingomonas faeni]|uniref:MFS transporter n=1 Tax=Sphingomonas faeni TaxID=185950 RepID=UPI0027D89050|nr:MFS transporter [Sphingomonas faeni]
MQFIVSIERPLCLVGVAVSFRIAYAAFDVPLTTLTSLLPCSEAERERYVRVRMAASAFSRLLITGLNAYLAFWSTESFATFGMAGLGMLCIAMILCAGTLRLKVRGMTPELHDVPRYRSDALEGALPSGRLMPLLVAFLVAVAIVPTLSRLLVYVGIDGETPDGALLLCAFSVGSVIGPVALTPTRRALKNYDPMMVVAAAGSLSALILGAAIISDALTAMVVGALLHGLALGMVGTLLWNRAASLTASGSERKYSMVSVQSPPARRSRLRSARSLWDHSSTRSYGRMDHWS